MKANHNQRPPTDCQTRESLRQKGQFWTPDWVAEAMVAYALSGGADHIFDPAVGTGAFFRAAKKLAAQLRREIHLFGTEIDPETLERALHTGLDYDDLRDVQISDFLLHPPERKFDAIVANPPYIRHHRISPTTKAFLKQLSARIIGKPLDGRTGYHVYFLIQALKLLNPGGRLSFIVPADTCEGVFAGQLWEWISENFRLDAVVTFAPEATPFPGVDTNPVILMIKATEPSDSFYWAECKIPGTDALLRWCSTDFNSTPGSDIYVIKRDLDEGIRTGLTRKPLVLFEIGPPLGDYVYVKRGIATGANEFFLMTKNQVKERRIPRNYLARVIARTRDVKGDVITEEDLEELDRAGRPTYLLCLGTESIDELPQAVRDYLKEGEKKGLHLRPLVSTRKPWYKMEKREIPPFLFAYLGRRNSRFIRNYAKAVPLTGFLCIYPRSNDPEFIEKLWYVLQNEKTRANLGLVAKSYGAGALKVEPRALEKLPLPKKLVSVAGLNRFRDPQLWPD